MDWLNLIFGPPRKGVSCLACPPPSSSLRSPPISLPKLHPEQDHKPHAIVVGASSPEARTLEQDVRCVPGFCLGGCQCVRPDLFACPLGVLFAAGHWSPHGAADKLPLCVCFELLPLTCCLSWFAPSSCSCRSILESIIIDNPRFVIGELPRGWCGTTERYNSHSATAAV